MANDMTRRGLFGLLPVPLLAGLAPTCNVIPFTAGQPEPIGLIIDHTYIDGECTTSIVREWEHGEGRRCRLCPPGSCRLTERGTCLVNVPWYVPEESAPLYSITEAGA